MNYPSSATISDRRSQYPINERLVVYGTESMQRILEDKYYNNTIENEDNNNNNASSKSSVLMVNGVNILNKNSVDCDTAMNRIIQRRKTHNRVERRRRDRMNNLFAELSSTIPALKQLNQGSNRADVLQKAILYIRQLQHENKRTARNDSTSPNFEFDEIGSLSSHDSSLMSSSPANNDMLYMPFSPSTNDLVPLIPKRKRLVAAIRPQHQYESIILFK